MDKPAVEDGDVLVRVRAAAVNPADWHVMRGDPYIARLSFGLRRPKAAIPGCDLAGVVEAAGGDVTSFRAGDEVFGSTFMRGFGALAEYASVSADSTTVVQFSPGAGGPVLTRRRQRAGQRRLLRYRTAKTRPAWSVVWQQEVWPQISGEPLKCVPKEIVVAIRQVVKRSTSS
jgi:hypothetical protein